MLTDRDLERAVVLLDLELVAITLATGARDTSMQRRRPGRPGSCAEPSLTVVCALDRAGQLRTFTSRGVDIPYRARGTIALTLGNVDVSSEGLMRASRTTASLWRSEPTSASTCSPTPVRA